MHHIGTGDIAHDQDEIIGSYLNPLVLTKKPGAEKRSIRSFLNDSIIQTIIVICFILLMSLMVLNTNYGFILIRAPIKQVFAVKIEEENEIDTEVEKEVPEPEEKVVVDDNEQPDRMPDVAEDQIADIPLGSVSNYNLPDIPDLPAVSDESEVPDIADPISDWHRVELKSVPVTSSITVDSIGVDTFTTIGLPIGSRIVDAGPVEIPPVRADTAEIEEEWGQGLEPHVYSMVNICLRSCAQSLFMYDAKLADSAAVSDWLTIVQDSEVRQLVVRFRGKRVILNIISGSLASEDSNRFYYIITEGSLSNEYKNAFFRKLTRELTGQLGKENCLKQIE